MNFAVRHSAINVASPDKEVVNLPKPVFGASEQGAQPRTV